MFDFQRSIVLGALIQNTDGTVTVCPLFHNQGATIPQENVTHQVVEELEDSSVIVVDLGPDGLLTDRVIIGVGHEENMRHINRSRYYQPFFG